jgi:hypothetical protein
MNAPNILMRLLYSLVIFFRFIVDGRFAAYVLKGWKPDAQPSLPVPMAPVSLPVREKPAPPAKPSSVPALQLLGILQREGRFVDFLQEDITAFDDGAVGAAARLVHDGCRKVLVEYITLEPLRSDGEGARVVVERGFDQAAIRLTGNVTGEPPFTGSLRHHGWRVAEVRLPAPPPEPEAAIIAPAEVEL